MSNESFNSTQRLKYASPDAITQIYKILYITNLIFTQNNIEYWMDGGTLLGAVRHQGIIPWDDDGDLQIWAKDEPLLKSLAPVLLNKYNIILKPIWFGYNLYFANAQPIAGRSWLYPSIDLFPVQIENDKIVYSYPEARNCFSKCYHDLETLYPLEKYQFGSFELYGPPKSTVKTYFDRCYGNDWATHAYRMYDHENEKMLTGTDRTKIQLTPEELKPAMPIDFDKPV